jgi:PHD/YefM family antitoxin component YafN of YafNO toxin-antitoxin module
LHFTKNSAIIITAEGVDNMPNIKPVSDLRNYNEVLKDIVVGSPVFLTKNGRGRYVIMDMCEYNELEKVKRNAEYFAKIDKSLKQFEEGRVIVKTMEELEEMAK